MCFISFYILPALMYIIHNYTYRTYRFINVGNISKDGSFRVCVHSLVKQKQKINKRKHIGKEVKYLPKVYYIISSHFCFVCMRYAG